MKLRRQPILGYEALYPREMPGIGSHYDQTVGQCSCCNQDILQANDPSFPFQGCEDISSEKGLPFAERKYGHTRKYLLLNPGPEGLEVVAERAPESQFSHTYGSGKEVLGRFPAQYSHKTWVWPLFGQFTQDIGVEEVHERPIRGEKLEVDERPWPG